MELTVHVGSILFEYTGGRSELVVEGSDVAEALADLDRKYPGIRFRIVDERGAIRPHVRLFLDQSLVEDLGVRLRAGATLHVLGALSGG
ncbi:MAG: MoaD/ThiS family protein [Planctomycetota bacterium]